MKIVHISGGLGNQMFQYAFALSLRQLHKDDIIKVDTQHYKLPVFKKYKGNDFYHNGFEIVNVFPNADIPVAGFREIVRLSYYIPNYFLFRLFRRILPIRKKEYVHNVRQYFCYDELALTKAGDLYYEGVWASFHYFEGIKDELKRVYAHSVPNEYNSILMREMYEVDSVGIHVRRGDYNTDPEFGGVCDDSYYKNAIAKIKSDGKDHVFFIFSNDLKWCKDNLENWIGNNKIVYITENRGKDSCWDMFLMRYCKDLVIANSSFSWWGAFMNDRNGRIIAPKKWVNRDCIVDIWDPKWIKL